ncbi:MAG: TlpA family protein disulfide reductase [Candidatus Hydrogenedentes bacterium]|jgi:thiol-disulfide isomerase/thioredoxin|nr:TlpA family protein disulfide reductase [Candidatus Hydrogenedentota bacterium]
MKRIFIALLKHLTGMVVLMAVCACGGPSEPPRYALQPGTKLIYAYVGDSVSPQSESQKTTGTCIFWVAAVSENGSHELYYEFQSDASLGKSLSWGKAVLHPDGTLANLTESHKSLWLRVFFPRVPEGMDDCEFEELEPNTSEVTPGLALSGSIRSVTLSGFPPRYTFKVGARIERGLDKFQREMEVAWSRGTGAPYRVTVHSKYLDMPGYYTDTGVRLKGIKRASQTEMNRKLPDIDLYLKQTRAYHEQLTEHQNKSLPGDEDHILTQWSEEYDQLIASLQEAWRNIRTPELRNSLERSMDDHLASKTYYVERHLKITKMLGLPAPDWELTDFSGARRRLEDFRDNVVLLDFWASWCPPCRKSLPAMEDIGERFQGRNFVLLGMNTEDPDTLENAENLIKELECNYLILHASSIEDPYNVQAIPTFVVLDTNGILRYHKSGFDEKTPEKLIEIIEQYLP